MSLASIASLPGEGRSYKPMIFNDVASITLQKALLSGLFPSIRHLRAHRDRLSEIGATAPPAQLSELQMLAAPFLLLQLIENLLPGMSAGA